MIIDAQRKHKRLCVNSHKLMVWDYTHDFIHFTLWIIHWHIHHSEVPKHLAVDNGMLSERCKITCTSNHMHGCNKPGQNGPNYSSCYAITSFLNLQALNLSSAKGSGISIQSEHCWIFELSTSLVEGARIFIQSSVLNLWAHILPIAKGAWTNYAIKALQNLRALNLSIKSSFS